ncbi:hypothetical protein GCM10025873_08820 [Demequina sediminis]|nr:hypothetical protein GCM10025873_08820 [Demequina sediminis]
MAVARNRLDGKDLNAQAYNEGAVVTRAHIDGFFGDIVHRRSCGLRDTRALVSEVDGPTLLEVFDRVASGESFGQTTFCEVCCLVQYGSPLGIGYLRGRPRLNRAGVRGVEVCPHCFLTSCDCEN